MAPPSGVQDHTEKIVERGTKVSDGPGGLHSGRWGRGGGDMKPSKNQKGRKSPLKCENFSFKRLNPHLAMRLLHWVLTLADPPRLPVREPATMQPMRSVVPALPPLCL